VESLLAFGAALVALRLCGRLLARARERRRAELAAWAAGLGAYAVAAAALAWAAAAGWSDAAFRVYYLFGGLLTAALLGVGSLALAGLRWAVPLGLVYVGLAVGVAVAVPLRAPVRGDVLPEAAAHLDVWPARALAVAGNTLGTAAVVLVALATLRRRPLGNALIVAGVAVAASGSSPLVDDAALTSVAIAAGAALLYAGFVARPART
jgi:hypothetical protein